MQDFMNLHKEGIYFYSYEYAPIEHVFLDSLWKSLFLGNQVALPKCASMI